MTPVVSSFFRSRSVCGHSFDRIHRNDTMIKRTVRPLFSVVFVFAAAAATLCLRVIVSGVGRESVAGVRLKKLPPVFNETLLKFAAVDLAEDSLKRDVEHLVDGDFRSAQSSRQRSFLSTGRYRVSIHARSVSGGPINLKSPEFYRLWLEFRRYLQDWWRHRQFQPDVLPDMVNILQTSKIAGNNRVFRSVRKHRTCAVVGNSGILLKSNLGNKIDSHEFIIRLNNARIGGFERDVGSKTSLSFINSNILHLCARREGCFCHPYGEKVPIMMYMCQAAHFIDYAICNSSHQAPLIITNPPFDVLCAQIVKYYSAKRFLKETGKPLEAWASAHEGSNFHYSSGMQAVMLALGICDEVSIFGFGKSDSAKHHYHTNQKVELSLHDYQAEYDLYEDLVSAPEAIPFISGKFKFPPVTIHR